MLAHMQALEAMATSAGMNPHHPQHPLSAAANAPTQSGGAHPGSGPQSVGGSRPGAGLTRTQSAPLLPGQLVYQHKLWWLRQQEEMLRRSDPKHYLMKVNIFLSIKKEFQPDITLTTLLNTCPINVAFDPRMEMCLSL